MTTIESYTFSSDSLPETQHKQQPTPTTNQHNPNILNIPKMSTDLSQQSQALLSTLRAFTKKANVTRSSSPTLESTNKSFTISTTFDFPDGGRFRVTLSAPPLTAFIDGQNGLPDGFLMEINNYIFSTLFNTTIPTPQQALSEIINKADELYVRSSRPLTVTSAEEDRMESSPLATAALMKQLSMIQGQDTRKEGYTAHPKNENLYIWNLYLYFDDLQQKFTEAGHEALELELRFPSDYPYAPPFIRVVAPYIRCQYVLPRGGICMQLFTTSGWTPVNSVDAICVQVRAMLLTGGLHVLKSHRYQYSYEGAKRDLQSAVKQHRWDEVDDVGKRKKMKY